MLVCATGDVYEGQWVEENSCLESSRVVGKKIYEKEVMNYVYNVKLMHL